MPKQVDHEQRRRHISAAVARIAASRGLAGLSFREVASEAGVSVSLVQHYFGNKEQLLIGTLDIESEAIGRRILGRLGELGAEAGPLDRVRTVAEAFLPTDDESKAAMLVYLGFAGAALTDERLRRADAFGNAENLLTLLTAELEAAAGAGGLVEGVVPETQASAILSLVLGLSLGVLLDQAGPEEAVAVLDAQLALLAR